MTDEQIAIWRSIAVERSADYLPAFKAISLAIQRTLRAWLAEWILAHPTLLNIPREANGPLLYVASRPYTPTNGSAFTYDPQDRELVARAVESGLEHVRGYLEKLESSTLSVEARKRYWPTRTATLTTYLRANQRRSYGLFRAEQLMVNAFLQFRLSQLPRLGPRRACAGLEAMVRVQLLHLLPKANLIVRAPELIVIATSAAA